MFPQRWIKQKKREREERREGETLKSPVLTLVAAGPAARPSPARRSACGTAHGRTWRSAHHSFRAARRPRVFCGGQHRPAPAAIAYRIVPSPRPERWRASVRIIFDQASALRIRYRTPLALPSTDLLFRTMVHRTCTFVVPLAGLAGSRVQAWDHGPGVGSGRGQILDLVTKRVKT